MNILKGAFGAVKLHREGTQLIKSIAGENAGGSKNLLLFNGISTIAGDAATQNTGLNLNPNIAAASRASAFVIGLDELSETDGITTEHLEVALKEFAPKISSTIQTTPEIAAFFAEKINSIAQGMTDEVNPDLDYSAFLAATTASNGLDLPIFAFAIETGCTLDDLSKIGPLADQANRLARMLTDLRGIKDTDIETGQNLFARFVGLDEASAIQKDKKRKKQEQINYLRDVVSPEVMRFRLEISKLKEEHVANPAVNPTVIYVENLIDNLASAVKRITGLQKVWDDAIAPKEG